jgi:hypothetical protein
MWKTRPVSSPQLFDLNIEEVLDHWEVEHAIREVIANALDEQLLSSTADVEIVEDGADNCRIRDFGRGLEIEHFTLSESAEKLGAPEGIIGKFGVGLKDAVAAVLTEELAVVDGWPHSVARLRFNGTRTTSARSQSRIARRRRGKSPRRPSGLGCSQTRQPWASCRCSARSSGHFSGYGA